MTILKIYLNILIFIGFFDIVLSIFFLISNQNLLTILGFVQGLIITFLDFILLVLQYLEVHFDIKECTWREIYMRRKFCLYYFYHILKIFTFAFTENLPLVVVTIFFDLIANLLYANQNSFTFNFISTVTFVMWTNFLYQYIIKLHML